MLPQNPYIFNSTHLETLFQPASQPHFDELKHQLLTMMKSNEELVSLNQQLRYQTEYLNKQVTFLNEKLLLVQTQNRRLTSKIMEEDFIISKRSRASDFKSSERELAELLDGGRRQLQQMTCHLQKKNQILIQQNNELKTLNQTNKLLILKLETINTQFRQIIRSYQTGNKTHLETTKSKRQRSIEQIIITSPKFQLKRQFSAQGMNSSQQSNLKQDVIEQLKQQNYLLRQQIFQINKRFQIQIQKLNLYIDKLLAKQGQMDNYKNIVSTLFNALTVSFIDFGNQKTQYQKKIIHILEEITVTKSNQQHMLEQINKLTQQITFLKQQSKMKR